MNKVLKRTCWAIVLPIRSFVFSRSRCRRRRGLRKVPKVPKVDCDDDFRSVTDLSLFQFCPFRDELFAGDQRTKARRGMINKRRQPQSNVTGKLPEACRKCEWSSRDSFQLCIQSRENRIGLERGTQLNIVFSSPRRKLKREKCRMNLKRNSVQFESWRHINS